MSGSAGTYLQRNTLFCAFSTLLGVLSVSFTPDGNRPLIDCIEDALPSDERVLAEIRYQRLAQAEIAFSNDLRLLVNQSLAGAEGPAVLRHALNIVHCACYAVDAEATQRTKTPQPQALPSD